MMENRVETKLCGGLSLKFTICLEKRSQCFFKPDIEKGSGTGAFISHGDYCNDVEEAYTDQNTNILILLSPFSKAHFCKIKKSEKYK